MERNDSTDSNRWLSSENRRWLLALARQALEDTLRGADSRPIADADRVELVCGAFVSVHRNGELRACLGRIETTQPLPAVICELARSVAGADTRFAPITLDEIAEIDLEISVLAPGEEIHSIHEIAVGVHGLIVEDGARRGLLLPQVAVEHGWDRLTFLQHACLKAGSSRDAWRNGARMFVFEALVFGDREPPHP
jgi:AmmeMemoRadiSam system protein A